MPLPPYMHALQASELLCGCTEGGCLAPSRRGRAARRLAQRRLQVRTLQLFSLVWVVTAPWGGLGAMGACTRVHAHAQTPCVYLHYPCSTLRPSLLLTPAPPLQLDCHQVAAKGSEVGVEDGDGGWKGELGSLAPLQVPQR